VIADEQYTIDTPENIEFRYAVAGIGSRFLAALIDTFLLILLQLAVLIVFGLLWDNITPGGAAESILTAIQLIVSFVFFWGYYIFFELVWNGQSPGKRIVRLRVVRQGGRPITFVASAIRNLIRIVDLLPFLYVLGLLTMFIDRRARRLGDLAAGTLVVKERQAVSLENLAARAGIAAAAAPAAPAAAATTGEQAAALLPNLHELTTEEYDMIQEFLRRRNELSGQSRDQLGVRLANQISERIRLPYDRGRHEQFLTRVANDYRRR
jgi:uncharacterized RDD family membrane protein YckC